MLIEKELKSILDNDHKFNKFPNQHLAWQIQLIQD